MRPNEQTQPPQDYFRYVNVDAGWVDRRIF